MTNASTGQRESLASDARRVQRRRVTVAELIGQRFPSADRLPPSPCDRRGDPLPLDVALAMAERWSR